MVVSLRPRLPAPRDAYQLWIFAGASAWLLACVVGNYLYERVVRRRLQRFEEMHRALSSAAD